MHFKQTFFQLYVESK